SSSPSASTPGDDACGRVVALQSSVEPESDPTVERRHGRPVETLHDILREIRDEWETRQGHQDVEKNVTTENASTPDAPRRDDDVSVTASSAATFVRAASHPSRGHLAAGGARRCCES